MTPIKNNRTQLVFKSAYLSSLFLELSQHFALNSQLLMDDTVVVYDTDIELYVATCYVWEA